MLPEQVVCLLLGQHTVEWDTMEPYGDIICDRCGKPTVSPPSRVVFVSDELVKRFKSFSIIREYRR